MYTLILAAWVLGAVDIDRKTVMFLASNVVVAGEMLNIPQMDFVKAIYNANEDAEFNSVRDIAKDDLLSDIDSLLEKIG